MSLDGVDIVMEVEDHFKVILPDHECSQVRTVADLAAVVLARLPRSPSYCPTARRFFQLRAHATEVCKLRDREMRPATPLESAFPKRRRRRHWAALRNRDRVIPKLQAPPRVDAAFLLLTGIAVFAWLILTPVTWAAAGPAAALAMAILSLILGGLMISSAYARFATCFPHGCMTVGDLVRVTMPPQIPSARGDRLAAEQAVLDEVREITARHVALPLDKVSANARFAEDLGMT